MTERTDLLNSTPSPLSSYGSAAEPWRRTDGSVVACVEKIKVMAENLQELADLAQEAMEDGVLMGSDETQIRAALHQLVDEIVNPYSS